MFELRDAEGAPLADDTFPTAEAAREYACEHLAGVLYFIRPTTPPTAVAAEYAPMWPDQSARIVAALDAAQVRDELGNAFATRDVDHAFQSVAETWCAEEGVTKMPDFEHGTALFDEVAPRVIEWLGVDSSQVEVP